MNIKIKHRKNYLASYNQVFQKLLIFPRFYIKKLTFEKLDCHLQYEKKEIKEEKKKRRKKEINILTYMNERPLHSLTIIIFQKKVLACLYK
jgi:hypothetical protein